MVCTPVSVLALIQIVGAKKEMDRLQKPKSMFRSFIPADLITLGNANCGMASIFLCLSHVSRSPNPYFWTVFLLLPMALLCDILDGFVARHFRHHHLGVQTSTPWLTSSPPA